ncbi:hypothetical protein JG688_00013263 [Phytophthora aleatoria]|uniref:Uncharacterized protein n=1 Tax=Phytophthora aleatoria TaxID=2496075 RepID=A0A8J5J126_9STRA|nr:hypothetical protein JG688_00013263 [Phytophthora aleatoria]
MERGKVSLLAKFGRQTINFHYVFASAPASTVFLRAYALNENKSSKQKSRLGHKNIWGCTSKVCDWQVSFTKKRPSKSANTKLAFCPPNVWFVSSMDIVHSPSCDSVGQCSSDLLVELPGIKSALVKGLSCARVRIASSLKVVDNANVDHQPALIYRAIARAKKMMAA